MSIIDCVATLLYQISHGLFEFMSSISLAPGVNLFSISLAFLAVGIVVSVFVQTGKA